MLAPYRLDNLLIDGYDVIVNKPKAAAYRAPGATVAAYAAESVVDDKLSISKLIGIGHRSPFSSLILLITEM